MNKSGLCCLAVMGFIAFIGTSAQAQVVTGETILNPYFGTTPDYSNWTFSPEFRGESSQSRITFDVKPSGGNTPGYSNATGMGKTGAAIAAEQSLDANSSYFKGFDFSLARPYYTQLGPYAGPVNGAYQMYFEVNIYTTQGGFRANSNFFNPIDFTAYPDQTGVVLSPTFTWNVAFLGDPSAYNDGLGVLLADVTSITYAAVVYTEVANMGAGSSFATFDSMSLTYMVSTVPEPSQWWLVATGLLFLVTQLKLRGRTH